MALIYNSASKRAISVRLINNVQNNFLSPTRQSLNRSVCVRYPYPAKLGARCRRSIRKTMLAQFPDRNASLCLRQKSNSLLICKTLLYVRSPPEKRTLLDSKWLLLTEPIRASKSVKVLLNKSLFNLAWRSFILMPSRPSGLCIHRAISQDVIVI